MNSNEQISENKKTDFPYKKYKHTYQVLGGITIALFGLWVGSILFGSEESFLVNNALAYWTNISTELLGVVITIVVINQFTTVRDREKLKKRLIRQAGSPSHAVATEAVARLREEDWLIGDDGLLQGADLTGANLEGVNLSKANLQGAKLYRANLHRAIVEYANLESADLRNANLSNARLAFSNFDNAHMNYANLENSSPWGSSFVQANLEEANFRKANMPTVNLTGANLKQTSFEGTNLKSSKLIDVNLVGTNLEGANISSAIISPSNGGQVLETMPRRQIHLTILPNSDRVAFTEQSLEDFVSDIVEYLYDTPNISFVHYDDVDWNMFTLTSHPDYEDWHRKWLKKTHE